MKNSCLRMRDCHVCQHLYALRYASWSPLYFGSSRRGRAASHGSAIKGAYTKAEAEQAKHK